MQRKGDMCTTAVLAALMLVLHRCPLLFLLLLYHHYHHHHHHHHRHLQIEKRPLFNEEGGGEKIQTLYTALTTGNFLQNQAWNSLEICFLTLSFRHMYRSRQALLSFT